MELQWEILNTDMVKFDLPTEHHVLSVVLDRRFLDNWLTDKHIRHCHGHFEVHYVWDPAGDRSGMFEITPPGVWHMGRIKEDGAPFLTIFHFHLTDRSLRGEPSDTAYGTALENFLFLTEVTQISDTFGGSALMDAIRREVARRENACFERIHALLHLLMVEMACSLPGHVPQRRKASRYTMEDFLPERVEMFLAEHCGDPDCSRERLARELSVSERQLGRILEQIYHKSFRQMLLEHRMEFAEAWRLSEGLSAAETACKVGYSSVRGFQKAYEKYHGRKYYEQVCQKKTEAGTNVR